MSTGGREKDGEEALGGNKEVVHIVVDPLGHKRLPRRRSKQKKMKGLAKCYVDIKRREEDEKEK